jgi:hypothetical protein
MGGQRSAARHHVNNSAESSTPWAPCIDSTIRPAFQQAEIHRGEQEGDQGAVRSLIRQPTPMNRAVSPEQNQSASSSSQSSMVSNSCSTEMGV